MTVGEAAVKAIKLFGSVWRRKVILKAGTNITITESVSDDESTLTIAASGGGSGAPTDAQYVTLATNATLTNERVLTAGHGVDLVDAGAGSTITVDVDETELDHSAITTGMAWSSSGHTGTASRLAGFNGSGAAAYYQIGVDVQAYDAGLGSLTSADASAGQPYVTAANTWAAASIAPVPNYTGETWTRHARHGRMVDLLAADIANVKTSPPTGWTWSTTTGVTSADITSGVLTITAGSSGTFNTPTGDPYLYAYVNSPNFTVIAHIKNTGNESFEGGYVRFRFGDSNAQWYRIGCATNSGDVEFWDGTTAITPTSTMAAGDWAWIMIRHVGGVMMWWMQTNGSTDSAMPTEFGSTLSSQWVFAGLWTFNGQITTATAPRIGLGVLRAGAPSGSWTLVSNYFRVYFDA